MHGTHWDTSKSGTWEVLTAVRIRCRGLWVMRCVQTFPRNFVTSFLPQSQCFAARRHIVNRNELKLFEAYGLLCGFVCMDSLCYLCDPDYLWPNKKGLSGSSNWLCINCLSSSNGLYNAVLLYISQMLFNFSSGFQFVCSIHPASTPSSFVRFESIDYNSETTPH
jgi:hypothetical protein